MTIINMSGGKPAKPIVVEAVEETPSTLPYTFSPREGVDYLSSVTVGKDPNLVPENVKSGVSIFGTEGTYQGSGGGGGNYSSLFAVNFRNIYKGNMGFSQIPITGEIGNLGTEPAGMVFTSYWGVGTDRLYTADSIHAWFVNPVEVRTSQGVNTYAFTLPSQPAGSHTILTSELPAYGPWPVDVPFTAHGSFSYTLIPTNQSAFRRYDENTVYECDVVSDGTNLTITYPQLEGFESTTLSYDSGKGSAFSAGLTPVMVEVTFT